MVDIVFVHGLRGGCVTTWSKGEVCWPRDLLKEEIPDARVITWGYDSKVANLLTYASHESIFGHAERLLADLARLRRDSVSNWFLQHFILMTVVVGQKLVMRWNSQSEDLPACGNDSNYNYSMY